MATRTSAEDPYSRLSYRRLIAWPERIEREWPFLERQLARAPEASVLDLGCGTGEHARFLASRGYRTLGIDRSEAQIEQAREYEDEHPPHGPRFALGDLARLGEATDGRFGAAICLGNTLPHLEDEDLAAALEALAARLRPGGRLVLQILNYERILARRVRFLPPNFRPDPERSDHDPPAEIVLVRLMTPDGDRHVLFHPLTLALHPGQDPPVTLERAREVRLRAWTRPQLEPVLARHGFAVEAAYGDMTEGAYEPRRSQDLVVVASRLRTGRPG